MGVGTGCRWWSRDHGAFERVPRGLVPDLYQVATSLLAAGDREEAERAVRFLFERQQLPDGSFPQNSQVDGTQEWTNTQMDEVSFPLVLAWQLGMTDGQIWSEHVKPAADYVVENGPFTQQERWENQSGWRPSAIDQRAVVDTTFLELVRLGVEPADDPVIRNSVALVDDQLAVDTPNGTFWHRFNEDATERPSMAVPGRSCCPTRRRKIAPTGASGRAATETRRPHETM